MRKADFPVFSNNPDVIYLDSAATLQKPTAVIEWVKQYLENDYANIHRGRYWLSERSEELFSRARLTVAEWINAEQEEVIFTSSSTDSVNLLAQSMVVSWWLKEWDCIVLCEADHHANIVPRQMAAQQVGCRIQWVWTTPEGTIDIARIQKLLVEKTVRVVACSLVSNVLGIVNDVERIVAMSSDDVYVVVDCSQAAAHMVVDTKALWADFLFFTGHKLWAHTWVGVLYGKKALLKSLNPARWGGWSIASVTTEWYTLLWSPDKFEPGTPNLVWVASFFYALEYMKKVWWSKEWFFDLLRVHESTLISYTLDQFKKLEKNGITLLWWVDNRVGVFSFTLPKDKSHLALSQYMATNSIAIRCGGQCAHPYHQSLAEATWSCRISFWLYTEMNDLETFFMELQKRLW